MKAHLRLPFALLIVVAAIVGGCSFDKAMTQHAAPDSVAVTTGAATTNDVEAVAYAKLVRAINANANPTPTREPLDAVLGAGVAVASALAGWYARHKAGAQIAARVMNIVAQTENKVPPTTVKN